MNLEELVKRFDGGVAVYHREWEEHTRSRRAVQSTVTCTIERSLAGEMRIVANTWYSVMNRAGRACVLAALYQDHQARHAARRSKYLEKMVKLSMDASPEDISDAVEYYSRCLKWEYIGYKPCTEIPWGHGPCYL